MEEEEEEEEGRGREKRWNDVQLHLIGLRRVEPQNRGVYHLLSNCAPSFALAKHKQFCPSRPTYRRFKLKRRVT